MFLWVSTEKLLLQFFILFCLDPLVIYGMTKDKAQNAGYIRRRGRKRAVPKCISHTSLRRGASSSSPSTFFSPRPQFLSCRWNVKRMSTTVLCSSWLEPLECHSKKKSPEDDVERDFRSLCLFSLLRLFFKSQDSNQTNTLRPRQLVKCLFF